ncbi:hypothetical protein Acr_00g0021550 [Actinidia rufa]|uniref:Uncharacterized protein n=1 Tax=Actinidia rufa TaxID=165716 RepID=A0A7J0DE40_9ERIC|nr:hypothetical protein Acr_00g0021550 [Actinidia rufa]
MVLDLAISLISSLPSPLLHGLAPIFPLPDFSADQTPNPSTAGDGTDRGYPRPWSRGLRVVVKILFCPRAGEEERGERRSQDLSLSAGNKKNLGKKKNQGIL